MPDTLTDYFEDIIARLIRTGRFKNRSEVIRAGLGLLEEKEFGHLSPRPVSDEALRRSYDRRSGGEEAAAAKASRRRKPSIKE